MYNYKKQLWIGFEEAVDKTKEKLAKAGFGIIFEEKINKKFKEKMNIDFDDYFILGVCNPNFAHKVLQSEKEMGLFLPCNIIIYKDNGNVFVSTILPTILMEIVNNFKIKEIAEEVEQKLKRIIDEVGE